MSRIVDTLIARWEYFDPKMKYQLLSGLVAYAVLKLGIRLDPVLEGLIALAVGGATGFAVPNGTSRVRKALKSSGRPRKRGRKDDRVVKRRPGLPASSKRRD